MSGNELTTSGSEMGLETPSTLGSNPCRTAKFEEESADFENHRTDCAQKTPEAPRKVKYPVRIKHRKAETGIYGTTPGYDRYRVAHYADERRIVRSFSPYAAARKAAGQTVRELGDGSPASALSAGQARDAFQHATGQRLSLNAVVAEYIEAATHLSKDASTSGRRRTVSVQILPGLFTARRPQIGG